MQDCIYLTPRSSLIDIQDHIHLTRLSDPLSFQKNSIQERAKVKPVFELFPIMLTHINPCPSIACSPDIRVVCVVSTMIVYLKLIQVTDIDDNTVLCEVLCVLRETPGSRLCLTIHSKLCILYTFLLNKSSLSLKFIRFWSQIHGSYSPKET